MEFNVIQHATDIFKNLWITNYFGLLVEYLKGVEYLQGFAVSVPPFPPSPMAVGGGVTTSVFLISNMSPTRIKSQNASRFQCILNPLQMLGYAVLYGPAHEATSRAAASMTCSSLGLRNRNYKLRLLQLGNSYNTY